MRKNTKLLIFLLSVFSFLFISSFKVEAEELQPTHVVIHYFRYEADYADYTMWIWNEGKEGKEHTFLTDGVVLKDDFGCYKEIPLTDTYEGATRMGIILKQGSGWNGARDVDGDRYFEITEENVVDNKAHVYLVEKTPEIGYSSTALDKSHKILVSYFSSVKRIALQFTAPATSYRILADNISVKDGTSNSKSFTVDLDTNADLTKVYTVEADFNGVTKTAAITFDGIYDTKEFEQAFYYDGNLGADYTKEKTTFTVWAPTQVKIELAIYNTGSPAKDWSGNTIKDGTDTPTNVYQMVKKEKGVFEYTVEGDLVNKYYTYRVYQGSSSVYKEIVDPYAKSTGINGLRGMIIDFSSANPEKWEYNSRPNQGRSLNEAIVYELHVRDLTSSKTWNGSDANRGKFLGLVEENTTYTANNTTVTTGFDHIKELGVTDVQLLPIYDHGVIDETRLNDPTYQQKVFNWGYMPENYNALEGSYSSNPYDGLARVKEFKSAVQKFNQNDIGVIMDVVFNHTGKTADSNFNILVPGYYHRKNGDSFSNGSGCGNETASERIMMRKFMIDSCVFWAKEYNLSGFRFDLMALHDYETMNLIAEELRKIDPSIIVYGEPWNGGSTPLPQSQDAGKTNIKNMQYVGAFNDESRDAIKGSVFNANEGAWLQGKTSQETVNKIKYGIVGGSSHSQVNFNGWHKTPINMVNYVSAHDNNTLWDKLTLTKVNKIDARKAMQKQANAIVLTSQGLSFLHAGVEIARSKPLSSGFDHNSYESPDSVNQIDWSRKVTYFDIFEYYKAYINLKKNHSAFNLSTVAEVQQKISFIETNNLNTIAYTIKDENDTYKEILVVHNGKGINTMKLEGKWQVLGNHTGLFDEPIAEINDGNLVLLENTSYILYKGDKVAAPTTTVTTQGSSSSCKEQSVSVSDMVLSLMATFSLVGTGLYLLKRK